MFWGGFFFWGGGYDSNIANQPIKHLEFDVDTMYFNDTFISLW